MFKKLSLTALILIMVLTSLLAPGAIKSVSAYDSRDEFGGFKLLDISSINALKTRSYTVYGTGEESHALIDFIEAARIEEGMPWTSIRDFTLFYKTNGVTVAFIEFRGIGLYPYSVGGGFVEWRFNNTRDIETRYGYFTDTLPSNLSTSATSIQYMSFSGSRYYSESIGFEIYNALESKQTVFDKVHALMQEVYQIQLINTTRPPVYISAGSLIELPTPTRTGYSFEGWYLNAGLTEPFTATTMPASDLTLYAKWVINTYTINFITNGGAALQALEFDYNSNITLPTPTKAGYEFNGWYSDLELTTSFTASTMPANDLTLYAGWTAIEDPTGPETEDPNEEEPTNPGTEEPEEPESLLEILKRKLIDPLNEKVFNPLNEIIFKPIYRSIIKPLADLMGAPLWSVWTGFILIIYIILRVILAAIFRRK
ncbi:MAG: InlB B-repeat-containing protein [Clostridia bacterium]|nr:InlB B-repeat-containing protein [Clostridia bacterium]